MIVARLRDFAQAARDFRLERAQRGVAHGASLQAERARVGLKVEPVESPDIMAFHSDFALVRDAGEQGVFTLEALQQS